MRSTKLFILFSVLLSLHLTVEAKYKQEYRNTQVTIHVKNDKTFAVAVLDKREVVLDHSQKIDFVGYLRSATWIAYPICTASKNPFSNDVAFTIANAIERSGAQITQVQTEISQTHEQVLEKLMETGADVLLLITVEKWRSDTKSYFSKLATDMVWDLTLNVYNKSGESVRENNTGGEDKAINPSMSTNKKKRQVVIDKYFKEKLEELFSEESIRVSLK